MVPGLLIQAVCIAALFGWTAVSGSRIAAAAGAFFALASFAWNVFWLKRRPEESVLPPGRKGSPPEDGASRPAAGDISEEDIWKREGEETEWMKRMLSHNVRMPMAVIAGYGELLEAGGMESRQEELECIRKICGNIQYLNRVLGVVLDTGRGDGKERQEYFDVLGCIREVAGYVKSMARRQETEVVVNSSRQEILFYGSRIQIMRAFYNLFENSLKYMKRGGTVYVTAEETEDGVLLVYKDDGAGMEEKEAERILQLGFRGSNALSEVSSGDGMGMYLVRRIVEEHGGRIFIRSGPDKGMAVYMLFQTKRGGTGGGSVQEGQKRGPQPGAGAEGEG